MTDTEKKRIEAICEVAGVKEIDDLSDGFHTFRQLYYQRMMLFATIVKQNKDKAWKSLRHEDGELCFGGGWFIVGIDTPEGSYTYHYENKYFDLFDCEILDYGKHWDGHTEKDVTRLLSLESNNSEIPNSFGKDTNVPSNDTISRQAAIDALETIGYDFSDSGLSATELAEVCEAVGDVRQDMIRMIKRLPPAQPERIQNNAVHLCDSCQYTYVTCPSHGNDAVFGDGKGNDNICACNKYRPISAQPERKKGKWIPVTKIYKVTEDQFPKTHIEWVDATEPDEIDAVRCSECGEVFDFQDARNWCTECGTDMR